jgi:hypothetical protein
LHAGGAVLALNQAPEPGGVFIILPAAFTFKQGTHTVSMHATYTGFRPGLG